MAMKNTAISAAKEASKLLMKHFGTKITGVRKKGGRSLVSDIDIACNDIILTHIRRTFPSHNIVSEETPEEQHNSDYTWYIDPLDGTHNYIKGIPLFGISIGLAHRGKMVLGVIVLPAFKKLYIAQKGQGATCNGLPIHTSTHKTIDFSTLLLDSSVDGRQKTSVFLKRTKNALFSERMIGCAVYSAALIAEGKADAWIIYHTHSWDIAAGFLLIEEAGGKVSGMNKREWDVSMGAYIASNTPLHQKISRLAGYRAL